MNVRKKALVGFAALAAVTCVIKWIDFGDLLIVSALICLCAVLDEIADALKDGMD